MGNPSQILNGIEDGPGFKMVGVIGRYPSHESICLAPLFCGINLFSLGYCPTRSARTEREVTTMRVFAAVALTASLLAPGAQSQTAQLLETIRMTRSAGNLRGRTP